MHCCLIEEAAECFDLDQPPRYRRFLPSLDASWLTPSSIACMRHPRMNAAIQNTPGASALLTDLYQITMAYGYWKAGKADQPAVFHVLFRKQPFRGGYTLAGGLEDSIRYLLEFRFEKSDLNY